MPSHKAAPYLFIMLPTYNRPELIIRAVTSVINQNYQNYKLVIFNDGSTKNYSELENIILNMKNIEYIKSDINIGINKSRNIMIDYCMNNIDDKNVYICTLSDDDYFAAKAFELIASEINKNPNDNWLCFNCDSLSQSLFNNTHFTEYSKMTYHRFVKQDRGDKHFFFKFNLIERIRYPDKYFKNGYEHIFYQQLPSDVLTIPKTVKVIEYQQDGLSLSPLYDNKRSFLTIVKHILSAPKEPIYYHWLIKSINPKHLIKSSLSEAKYYGFKRKLGLKVPERFK